MDKQLKMTLRTSGNLAFNNDQRKKILPWFLESWWTMQCVLSTERVKSNRLPLAQCQVLVRQGNVLFYLNYSKMSAKW